MKELFILRGVSGAGKSTVAKVLSEDGKWPICEADHWHYDEDGVYNWKAENLHFAHRSCQDRVSEAMLYDVKRIIVSNTCTTEKELKPYIDLAEKYSYTVFSLVVENRHDGSSVHAVPEDIVNKQERKLRNSIKLK